MQHEDICDALLVTMADAPPEPPPPPKKKKKVKKCAKIPPRFPLIDKERYNQWANHRRELCSIKALVDHHPPKLFTEFYLNPQKLDLYTEIHRQNMFNTKDILKKINLIQRTGGFVDCWQTFKKYHNKVKLLCKQRQKHLDLIAKNNVLFYRRLVKARSDMPLTHELNEEWLHTKEKLILGATLPFILFETESFDRGIKDPAFDKPANVNRFRVSMEIVVDQGAKIGHVVIELFNDVVPRTCALFLRLIRGDKFGYGYMGTSFFRIVPDLYCCCGDVVKNNGFGCYMEEGLLEPMKAENYTFKHTVPGVMSMSVTPSNEVCGHFNVIFKPLPQFDGKNVVFARIIQGPTEVLERISAMGFRLGTPSANVLIRECGTFNRRGGYRSGVPNQHVLALKRQR